MRILFRSMKLSSILYFLITPLLLQAEILGPFLLSDDEVPETLSASGEIYALSGDITGDLTITADDVTINLNERTLTGRIIISGQRVLIYGGNVIAPAPANNATADAGVIQINSSASNARIENCYVSAADSVVASVRGARGIQVDADDVIISHCFVKAGTSAANNGLAAGGIGIQNSGNRLLIEQSETFGGDGTPSDSASTTGAGGAACSITSGTSVNVAQSHFFGGAAGQKTLSAEGVTLANGGNGLSVSANVIITIDASLFIGGDSSTISAANVATAGNVVAGNGGRGIDSAALNLLLQNSDVRGGAAGSVTATSTSGIGSVGASLTGGQGGSAIRLNTLSSRSLIQHCSLRGGDSTLISYPIIGGAGINNVNPVSNTSRGGHGIDVIHQTTSGIDPFAVVDYCSITGGVGQDITSSAGVGLVVAVQGNNAGHGVAISAINTPFVTISNSIITTFKGGSVIGASTGASNNGGNGGDAVHLGTSGGSGAGISGIRILNNNIGPTGTGGDALGAGNIGGDSGNGIFVVANVSSVEVRNNTIAYIPAGGAGGGSSGADGQAIVNESAGAVIYGNFCHDITNAVPYALGPGSYIESPTVTGTPFVFSANPFGNVHQP